MPDASGASPRERAPGEVQGGGVDRPDVDQRSGGEHPGLIARPQRGGPQLRSAPDAGGGHTPLEPCDRLLRAEGDRDGERNERRAAEPRIHAQGRSTPVRRVDHGQPVARGRASPRGRVPGAHRERRDAARGLRNDLGPRGGETTGRRIRPVQAARPVESHLLWGAGGTAAGEVDRGCPRGQTRRVHEHIRSHERRPIAVRVTAARYPPMDRATGTEHHAGRHSRRGRHPASGDRRVAERGSHARTLRAELGLRIRGSHRSACSETPIRPRAAPTRSPPASTSRSPAHRHPVHSLD